MAITASDTGVGPFTLNAGSHLDLRGGTASLSGTGRVTVTGGHDVLTTLGGKMRQSRIRVLAVDHVTIEVEATPDAPASSYPEIAHRVAHHVKSLVGITTDVVIKAPGEIPRSQGKAVRVRDLRPKGE